MKLRYIYLAIAILGTLVPYYHFSKFLLNNGLDINLFFHQMMGQDIAAFFSWDVIISTLAVFVLIITEGKKRGIKNRWLYIVFNLVVGVSLALPAFLYSRQLAIDNSKK